VPSQSDPREAARSVLALIQKNEPIRSGEGAVHLAPGISVSSTAIACAAARYCNALGPDDSDADGPAAYTWVAGVLAGHHVTADPRVAGV
jgi:hypothetical protein